MTNILSREATKVAVFDPNGSAGDKRATEEQWTDLLSECSSLAGDLASNGTDAFNMGSRPPDGYPTSSMQDSAIGRGRVSDPTGWTVEARAGAKHRPCPEHGNKEHCPDCHGLGVVLGKECKGCKDSWFPLERAVRQMVTETADACNRIATAHLQSFGAQGLGGGQVFSIVARTDSWFDLVDKLYRGIDGLKGCAADVRDGPKTPEANAARRQMERELLDARNRLRGACSAMREMLPKDLPEPTREVCKTCGVARDVVTFFGQKPYEWIVSETSCRTDAKRIAEQAAKRVPISKPKRKAS